MLLSSLIPIIISTISTIIAVIMLFMTRKDMNRREQKDQASFIDTVYEQFQEQKLAMLQDRDALEVMARDTGKNAIEVKREALASVRINQAYRVFRLFQNDFLSDEQWHQFKSDTKLLFTLNSIQSRWTEIQKYYSVNFQRFIKYNVLETAQPQNTEPMKLTVIHSTLNCEASSCPTIYQDENGNYFMQGFKVIPNVKTDLNVPENEDIIELPKEFIQAFLDKQSK